MPTWLAGLLQGGVQAVMVYAGSAEDEWLRMPDSGYRVVFVQPEKDEACAIRIYRREAPP